MYRQGDVLIVPISAVPANLRNDRPAKVILAYGEVTGHHHHIKNKNVTAFYKEDGGEPISGGPMLRGTATNIDYITVGLGGADLDHEEHDTIHIVPGDYKITRQREFDALEGVRRVAD